MSKLWRSGNKGGRVGLRVASLLGEFRIASGDVYLGGPGAHDARLSRLERILLAGEASDRDSTGAFVWSTRSAAEAALNSA